MPRIVPILPQSSGSFVLKFAPVQSIFRTKFCSGLGLFFMFLRGKKCPVQPCPAPVQDRGIVTLLAFLALKVQGWISDMGIDGLTFVPKSGYFLLIWVKVCPQKLAFS